MAGIDKQHERRRERLLWLVIGAVVVLLVNQFGGAFLELFRSSPDRIGKAENRIRGEAAATSRYIAFESTLHGTSGDAWLIVLRHGSVGNYGVEVPPVSDEVRIYDIADEALRLDFRFQPGPETGRPGLQQKEELPFLFEVRVIRDLNGDGTPEIVGGFYSLFMEPDLPRPVLLRKVPGQNYNIQPLTTAFGLGPPPRSHGIYAQNERAYYRWITEFRDGRSKVAFRARPVAQFALTRGTPVFLTAVVVDAPSHASVPTLLLRADRLVFLANGTVAQWPCSPHSSVFRPATPEVRKFPAEIKRHWKSITSGGPAAQTCPLH